LIELRDIASRGISVNEQRTNEQTDDPKTWWFPPTINC